MAYVIRLQQMIRLLAPLVLFCALLGNAFYAANASSQNDEDEIDTVFALRDSGPREMSDDDIEDIRQTLKRLLHRAPMLPAHAAEVMGG